MTYSLCGPQIFMPGKSQSFPGAFFPKLEKFSKKALVRRAAICLFS
jgi:hypothetical protein